MPDFFSRCLALICAVVMSCCEFSFTLYLAEWAVRLSPVMAVALVFVVPVKILLAAFAYFSRRRIVVAFCSVAAFFVVTFEAAWLYRASSTLNIPDTAPYIMNLILRSDGTLLVTCIPVVFLYLFMNTIQAREPQETS